MVMQPCIFLQVLVYQPRNQVQNLTVQHGDLCLLVCNDTHPATTETSGESHKIEIHMYTQTMYYNSLDRVDLS